MLQGLRGHVRPAMLEPGLLRSQPWRDDFPDLVPGRSEDALHNLPMALEECRAVDRRHQDRPVE